MFVFQIQRVVVAFAKYVLGRVFTPEALAYFDFEHTTVSTLVFYDRKSRRKYETDCFFTISMFWGHWNFSFSALVEHKSKKDRRLPLQMNRYTILAYNKQYDELIVQDEDNTLTPIIQVVFSHAKNGARQPQFMDMFFKVSPLDRQADETLCRYAVGC